MCWLPLFSFILCSSSETDIIGGGGLYIGGGWDSYIYIYIYIMYTFIAFFIAALGGGGGGGGDAFIYILYID